MAKARFELGRKGGGSGVYLKEAFLFRWNLLALVGGVGVALLSPIAPVLLPLVGAAELVYLAGLVSIPKFRAAVDRKRYEAQRAGGGAGGAKASPESTLRELLERLPAAARQRFDGLRGRCLEMRRIAQGVGGRAARGGALDEVANPGLDRLLWVFLRLLVSQDSLQHFLASTNRGAIERQLEETRRRLSAAEAEHDERMLRSLRDSLATCELRLENYQKAEQNAAFVSLEIDRLESKIQTLSEMAVNRQDPDFISREVDSVTASITHTEAAMNELQLVTGLMQDLDQPPVILSMDLEQA